MINVYDYIEKAIKSNQNLNQILLSIEELLSTGQIPKGAATTENAVIECESLMISLREIYYSFYSPNSKEAKDFNQKAADSFHISISKLQTKYTAYKIVLPFLLPNQRSRWQGFKKTIGITLHHALNDFCISNNIIPLNNCAIIFTSFCNQNNKAYISDNDNKEAKDVMNILSKHLVIDDNGLICDIMYRTQSTAEQNRTEIILVEKEGFISIYNQL